MCACASHERAADRYADFAGYFATCELTADQRADSACYVNATRRVSISSRFADGHGFAQAGPGQ